MRSWTALALSLLLPALLLAACGDDDDDASVDVPDAGGYYGGVRDIQIVLDGALAETEPDPAELAANGGLVDPETYRARAAAYRDFAEGLRSLDPPSESASAQAGFADAALAIAGDLDAIAAALEAGDAAAETEAREDLVNHTIPFLSACEALGLSDCQSLAPAD